MHWWVDDAYRCTTARIPTDPPKIFLSAVSDAQQNDGCLAEEIWGMLTIHLISKNHVRYELSNLHVAYIDMYCIAFPNDITIAI